MTKHLQNYINQIKILSNQENISKDQIVELTNLINKENLIKDDIHRL